MYLMKMVKIKVKKFLVYDKWMKIVVICWMFVKCLEEILIVFLVIVIDFVFFIYLKCYLCV